MSLFTVFVAECAATLSGPFTLSSRSFKRANLLCCPPIWQITRLGYVRFIKYQATCWICSHIHTLQRHISRISWRLGSTDQINFEKLPEHLIQYNEVSTTRRIAAGRVVKKPLTGQPTFTAMIIQSFLPRLMVLRPHAIKFFARVHGMPDLCRPFHINKMVLSKSLG